MRYRILIPRPVQKQLDALPSAVRERAIQRIAALQENPRPPGCVKLIGNEYRIRVGDYRIRYAIYDQESVVVVLHCAHRKEVYRR